MTAIYPAQADDETANFRPDRMRSFAVWRNPALMPPRSAQMISMGFQRGILLIYLTIFRQDAFCVYFCYNTRRATYAAYPSRL